MTWGGDPQTRARLTGEVCLFAGSHRAATLPGGSCRVQSLRYSQMWAMKQTKGDGRDLAAHPLAGHEMGKGQQQG